MFCSYYKLFWRWNGDFSWGCFLLKDTVKNQVQYYSAHHRNWPLSRKIKQLKTVKKFSFCMQVRPWRGLLVVLLYWLVLVGVFTVLDDQIQPPGHGLHHGLDVVDVLSLALCTCIKICLRLHSNKWRCFLMFLRWNHPAVHSSIATLLSFIEKWDKEFIFVSIIASNLVQGCSYTVPYKPHQTYSFGLKAAKILVQHSKTHRDAEKKTAGRCDTSEWCNYDI